jgi:hypothetical protein
MDETQVQSKAKSREPTPAPKPESTKHLRVLANGAVYDTTKGRIVSSKNVTTKITSERSVEMQSRRQELKRQAMIRAANRVAEQGGSVNGSEFKGDMAFVEAITESMTMKALTVNDPKAVDAARFIYQETAIAETRTGDSEPGNQDALAVIGASLVEYARRKGLLSESDISESNNSAYSRVIDVSPTDQETSE